LKKLNLPEYTFQIVKSGDDTLLIFDIFRRRKIKLTPEEWVRQNILRFLMEEKGVPQSLISMESGVKINRLSRRYDAVIYNRHREPLLLVECKAPSVSIQQVTFDQIVAYNRTLKARYMLVTNGIKHYFCRIDVEQHKYIFMDDIPTFNTL
jgi:hypothetical protein